MSTIETPELVPVPRAQIQSLVPKGMTVILVRRYSYLGQPFLRGPLDEQHLSSDGAWAHGNQGHRDLWAKPADLVREDPEIVVRCDVFEQGGKPSTVDLLIPGEGRVAALCLPCFTAGHLSEVGWTMEPYGNRFGCSCCGRSTYTSIGD